MAGVTRVSGAMASGMGQFLPGRNGRLDARREAVNGNAELAIGKPRGFRTYHDLKTAPLRQLGHLPAPTLSTHRFW